MSKNFIIQISWILAFFGLIFMFPDFFAKGYQYLKLHSYLFILIFDIFLIIMYFLSMRDFKIKHGIIVTLALVAIGSSTLAYAYVYKSTDIAFVLIVLTTFIFGFHIQKKITIQRSHNGK